jgi:benzoyl-CoA reductase/2-hydroxyglutaryl-CoA dehydratase subunit BcrC/BadD/HgdB
MKRGVSALNWFSDMVDHALQYAEAQRKKGRHIVGIMCEYTPREIIMAAGGAPVCLCGGDVDMISPAEGELPSNLCPLIKSTYGYHVQAENPFLEMADLVVAETTCDGKKKMFELMARTRAMHVLELPQKPADPDAFEHWMRELRKLRTELEKRFQRKVTDGKLREAIREMNRERTLRRKLAELMKSDRPPLTGRELLGMKSIISCMPEDLREYERAARTLPGRKIKPPAESRVRVLLTGVPVPHGAERVMDLIEGSGGLVVCQENCSGIKPILENIDPDAEDPIRAIAEKYFHLPCSVMTRNDRRMETLRTLISEYRPQCVVELVWHACLTYSVESRFVKDLAEKEFSLSYLQIDTDYAPSDSARIAVRVEALFETVRGHEGAPGGTAKPQPKEDKEHHGLHG